MSISRLNAQMLTKAYSLARSSGFLNTNIGQRLFTKSYFFYKKHLEDPFGELIDANPALLRGGDILDVGANIGYTSAVFARGADPDATVYAFEPEPFNYRLLHANSRAFAGGGKICPVHLAVGSHIGEGRLWINVSHHADHRIVSTELGLPDELGGHIKVPMTSIDAFLEGKASNKPITWIKIDVQGFELPVCEGMDRTVHRNPKVIVAVEYMPQAMKELGFSPPSLLQWFKDRGFNQHWVSRHGIIAPGVSPELAKTGYADLIFSRMPLIRAR